jgi:hypothetical protein
MHVACFVQQHWASNTDGFDSPSEQVLARNEKVRPRQHGEFFRRQSIDNRSDSGPVHLAYAHRTRFTAGIQDAAPNLLCGELTNCRCNKIGLSMRRGVAIRPNSVSGGQHYLSIEHQERAERMVAGDSSLTSQFDRPPRKGFLNLGRFQATPLHHNRCSYPLVVDGAPRNMRPAARAAPGTPRPITKSRDRQITLSS